MGIGNRVRDLLKHFDSMSVRAKARGYSRAYLMADYLRAYLVHRCTITDYFLYEFYALSHRGRKEYVTLPQMFPYVRMNPKNAHRDFGKKDLFLQKYDAFVKRDWIGREVRNTREEFDAFCDKHSACIVKRRDACGGEGTHRFEITPESREELWRQLTEEDSIAEELIVQCPEMAKLHPDSVNTIRPFIVNGKFCSASVRMGVGGAFVDNGCMGGIYAAVDVETGIILSPAANFAGERFLKHPTTGVTILGYQIPQWDKVHELVREANKLAPDMVLIGYDVAITPDGPVLVEGNDNPGSQMMQSAIPRGQKKIWRDALTSSSNY